MSASATQKPGWITPHYEVRSDDAFGNSWRYGLWNLHHEIARIGKPVDRHRVVHDAPNRECCRTCRCKTHSIFPQPFCSRPSSIPIGRQSSTTAPSAPSSATRSAIPSTQKAVTSTLRGRVRNWWTPPIDKAHFDQAAVNLEKQYDAYELFPGVHVNGKQTINENIADLGGIAAAYDAIALHTVAPSPRAGWLHTAISSSSSPSVRTGVRKTREAALRNQVLTDPHAPAKFRADIVRNSDAWYKAFNVKPEDKLYLAPERSREDLVTGALAFGGEPPTFVTSIVRRHGASRFNSLAKPLPMSQIARQLLDRPRSSNNFVEMMDPLPNRSASLRAPNVGRLAHQTASA